MSHPLCYTTSMKIKNELLKPLFDLDGTLITEDRHSDRLFDFFKPWAILNLTENALTPLGVLVRDSGKQFDLLTARGPENETFIRIALSALGCNVRNINCVGVDIESGADMLNVSSTQVVINKQNIVKTLNRKLVDNDPRNLEGLGKLGELVTQTQTEF